MNLFNQFPEQWQGCSAIQLEGALLAANCSPTPLVPELWLPALTEGAESLSPELNRAIIDHLQAQYEALKVGEYQLPAELALNEVLEVQHNEFAEGFLLVWPFVEPEWHEKSVSDGTTNMLSALMMTIMLWWDEEGTIAQMEAAEFAYPELSTLYQQLPMMLNEVAQAADELIIGSAQAQSVNPYKEIGRNDPCPCGSGKKFKQCCGK
ncbi:UPF0149 family protein [Vibrio sp. SS-MA-C1-2]|uniref:UPF0149 family protein n=1 Tax=Vibrio sp. SS-MA-C1-2 TaxID=2908646 RepID=UPI001F21729F|nr:UPF0149 family protein [Vibrio sp. SS-MA-C1-2]UJF19844.1 UPF0149 family protein [Vibrio sp. SS-MA-C1-2]